MIKILKEEIYHNYQNPNELKGEIIFCVDNPEDSKHYGSIHRIFNSKKAKLDNGEVLKLASDFYGVSKEKIKKEVYPSKIVTSAGVWDDIEFINYLYDENYFNKFDAIITPNGAIVFDYKLMEIIND